jgi:DNA-binding CsgD family transcriptional regulator
MEGNLETPATSKSKHSNKGNRRTGPTRGTHSGLRRGTLDWHKDPAILTRLETVLTLSLSGKSAREIAEQLELHPATIYSDRDKIRELAQERPLGSLSETVGRLRWVMEQAETAFLETKETSLNRSAYLNTYLSATTAEAKLLGQEPTRKVEAEVTLHDGDRQLRSELEALLRSRGIGLDDSLGMGTLALEAKSPAIAAPESNGHHGPA